MHLNESGLQIGGGNGVALNVDNELLNGRTTSCSSFNNKPLTKTANEFFEVVAMEVYALG